MTSNERSEMPDTQGAERHEEEEPRPRFVKPSFGPRPAPTDKSPRPRRPAAAPELRVVGRTSAETPSPQPAPEPPLARSSTPPAPSPAQQPAAPPPAPPAPPSAAASAPQRAPEPPPPAPRPAPAPTPEPAPVVRVTEPPSATPTEQTDPEPAQSAPLAPRGQLVFTFAGKGGVGKTTVSISLAQRAAAAGLRVVLVDANVRQGDIRGFLRLDDAALPTIYQAAATGELSDAIVAPADLSGGRDLGTNAPGFAAVFAPPSSLVEESVVTPALYMRLVEQARDIADLVIVDTQIIDPTPVTLVPIVSEFILPNLATDAWGVGIADSDPANLHNGETVLGMLAQQGVPPSRLLTLVNRAYPAYQSIAEGMLSKFAAHSTPIGIVHETPDVKYSTSAGRGVGNEAAFADVLDMVLGRVFPNEVRGGTTVAQAQTSGQPEAPQGRRGLWSRRERQ